MEERVEHREIALARVDGRIGIFGRRPAHARLDGLLGAQRELLVRRQLALGGA